MSENPSSGAWKSELFGQLQLSEYWAVLRRRKWWFILTSIAVCLATAAFVYRLPNVYRAETVILVDPQQVPDKYVSAVVSGTVADRLTTLQQQVLSPTRLQRLIESMGMYPDPKGRRTEEDVIRSIQKAITVEVVNPGGGRLSAFRIAYHGTNPPEVAAFANQLAQTFIDENLKVREVQSEGTAEFLDTELRGTKMQLDQKDNELSSIKSQNVLDLPESKSYHLEALASLRSQLQSSQDRVARAQADKVLLQSLAASTGEEPTIDLDAGGAGRSPYQTQIQRLEAHLADLQGRYGPNYPDVVKARRELEALKAKAAREQNQTGSSTQSVGPVPTSGRNVVVDAQLQKLTQEIEEQTRLQARLQEQINFHISKLQQVPLFEQKIAGLLRDDDILRTHYTGLLDKKLSAELANALESHQKAERFVILDRAVVPTQPFAPQRRLFYLAGLLGGLLGGLVLAFVAEVNDETVRSDFEAERIVGKPVLAGIPRIISKQERRWQTWRALGLVTGTAVCSALLGLGLSYAAQVF